MLKVIAHYQFQWPHYPHSWFPGLNSCSVTNFGLQPDKLWLCIKFRFSHCCSHVYLEKLYPIVLHQYALKSFFVLIVLIQGMNIVQGKLHLY